MTLGMKLHIIDLSCHRIEFQLGIVNGCTLNRRFNVMAKSLLGSRI